MGLLAGTALQPYVLPVRFLGARLTIPLNEQLQHALGDTYVVDRELPPGGMSRLFLATERSLDRKVVIKLLSPELTSEVSAQRFQRETLMTARLQHPHILPVLSAGARNGLLYYITPYVEGESLRRRLASGVPLPVHESVQILREVSDALATAHEQGILHRDLKPENILLSHGHAVLADFGIARAVEQASATERLTGTGLGIGTPAYMAPEQLAGDPNTDARADVYALGAVAYEMLTGRAPFAGSTPQALAARLTSSVAAPHMLRADIPKPVSDAVVRALAPDANDRFATADEFRQALDTHPSLAQPAAPAAGAANARPRWLAIGAGVALVAVIAVVTVQWMHSARALDANVVAVAPFEILNPRFSLWHEGMVDVLSRTLDGAGPLRTVAPSIVVQRWTGRADAESARELGRRTGAGLAVYGNVANSGRDSVHIVASMVDVPSGRALGDVELRSGADDIDRLADSVAVALLNQLNRSRPIGAFRFTGIGARSRPALKAFLEGEQFLREGEYDSATTHYKVAVEEDPQWPLALRRVSDALGWAANPYDTLVSTYALRAGQLNHGLSPRESLFTVAESLGANLYLTADSAWSGRASRLFELLATMIRLYPDDPEGWYLLGDARYHFGYVPGHLYDARQTLEPFERAVGLDSMFAPAYEHPVQLALMLDDSTNARRYAQGFEHASRRGDRSEIDLTLRALTGALPTSAAAQRAVDGASAGQLNAMYMSLKEWPDSTVLGLRAARAMAAGRSGIFTLGFDSITAIGILNQNLIRRGHLRDGCAGIEHAPPGLPVWRFTLLCGEVGVITADSATRTFQRALAIGGQDPRGLFSALPWWLEHRDTASLTAAVGTLQRAAVQAPDPRRRARAVYFAALASAYLATARGDTTLALRRLAALPDTTCPNCLDDGHLDASLRAARGDIRGAIAILTDTRAVRFGGAFDVLQQLAVARLAEQAGERDVARRAYTYVVDMWRDGDPEAQHYVTEARTGLQRLARERR